LPARPEQILIVGASVRAAAASAQRAGLQPLGIDQFGDVDSQALCQCLKLDHFPRGLLAAARRFPDVPWVYTGALENRPRVIEQLAQIRRLYGNTADRVTQVRDPFKLAAVLRKSGLEVPRILRASEVPREGKWLRKPRRSGGGAGITDWDEANEVQSRNRGHYLQQFIPGKSVSVVFVATQGQARLLGITRQLIGCSWCGTSGYRYCGSLGPISVSDRELHDVTRLGSVLADQFSMQGLFGVDAVLHNERVWTLEVNPRYSASIEILERRGVPLFPYHMAACSRNKLLEDQPTIDSRLHAKAIIYARRSVTVADSLLSFAAGHSAAPFVADIPAPGSTIATGQPVVTVFAAGNNGQAVLLQLRKRVRRIQSQLGC
jgi:predicted ATP-grasp superfamily ATP-dependent carboligase